MCGIIGFYNLSGKSHGLHYDKFMEQGLLVSALRGMDSTGIFVSTPEDLLMYKKDVASHDFGNFRGAKSAYYALRGFGHTKTQERKGAACIGHTRAATYGKINTANAHPFSLGDIVMAHNGTVSSKKGGWESDGTDSEEIARELSEMDRTPKNVTDYLAAIRYGAYALVWYDNSDNSMNFVRNEDRPLWFVYDDRSVLFGSEPNILTLTGLRTGVLGKEYTISELPTFHYKKVFLSEERMEDHKFDPKPKYVAPATPTTSGYGGSYYESGSYRGNSRRRFNTTQPLLTYQQGGMCCWCANPIPDREMVFAHKSGDDVFCSECTEGDSEVADYLGIDRTGVNL